MRGVRAQGAAGRCPTLCRSRSRDQQQSPPLPFQGGFPSSAPRGCPFRYQRLGQVLLRAPMRARATRGPQRGVGSQKPCSIPPPSLPPPQLPCSAAPKPLCRPQRGVPAPGDSAPGHPGTLLTPLICKATSAGDTPIPKLTTTCPQQQRKQNPRGARRVRGAAWGGGGR